MRKSELVTAIATSMITQNQWPSIKSPNKNGNIPTGGRTKAQKRKRAMVKKSKRANRR